MRFNEVNSSEMLFCTYTNVDIFSYIINKYKGSCDLLIIKFWDNMSKVYVVRLSSISKVVFDSKKYIYIRTHKINKKVLFQKIFSKKWKYVDER